MGRLELEDGLKARQKITQAQQKKIKKLYLDAAKWLEKEIEAMNRGTKSESLQKSELEKLVKKLKAEAEKIGLASEEIIKQGMQDIVDATLEDAKVILADLGLPIQGAYSNVASEIIESIVTGKIYKGHWSLSASIWDDIKKTQSDILKVVAEGRAMNKSSYEIAKDLERYVNPNAKKDWDWSKVYPGTKKKVDYNAQRLARTLSNHAYQQGVIASAKDNPFVKGIKWNVSNNHDRVCEVCEERANQNKYGLGKGVYPEDKVPMDHPNGMCVLTRVMPSSSERAKRLADWVNGKSDPEMDKWYKSVYGKEPPEGKTEATPKPTPEITKADSSKEKDPLVRFSSKEEAQNYSDAMVKKLFGDKLDKLSEAEKSAVEAYTGDSYKAMNSYLRKGKIERGGSSLTNTQIKSAVSTLKSLIEKSPVSERLLSYRGGSIKEFGGIPDIGDILEGKSFLSTSLSRDIAKGFTLATQKLTKNATYLMELEIPSGTHALPATSISKIHEGYSWLDESEMLLNPNQKIKVVSVDWDEGIKTWVIRGEVT